MASKPAVGLLIGPPPEGDEYESESDAGTEAKDAAAAAALKAFKANDAKALSDALTAHYEACAMGK